MSSDNDDGDNDVIASSGNKAVCNIDFSVLDMMVKSAFRGQTNILKLYNII